MRPIPVLLLAFAAAAVLVIPFVPADEHETRLTAQPRATSEPVDPVWWAWRRSDLGTACIGVAGRTVAARARIEQRLCDEGADQQWSAIPVNTWGTSPPRFGHLRNRADPAMCLGVPEGAWAPGSDLAIEACGSAPDQLWAAFRAGGTGTFYLQNFDSWLNVGVARGDLADGARVGQWPHDAGAPDQRWY